MSVIGPDYRYPIILVELKEVTYDNYGPGDKVTNIWSATFEVEKKWKGNSFYTWPLYETKSYAI